MSFERRIRNVIKRANETDFDDAELRSSLARYACVLSSGFIEESVRHYVGQWSAARSHPFVARFVEKELDSFWNPKLGKILDLLGRFSADWRTEYEDALTDEQRDSINSIVNLRNGIAHGQDVGVTPIAISRMFSAVVDAMGTLDAVIG